MISGESPARRILGPPRVWGWALSSTYGWVKLGNKRSDATGGFRSSYEVESLKHHERAERVCSLGDDHCKWVLARLLGIKPDLLPATVPQHLIIVHVKNLISITTTSTIARPVEAVIVSDRHQTEPWNTCFPAFSSSLPSTSLTRPSTLCRKECHTAMAGVVCGNHWENLLASVGLRLSDLSIAIDVIGEWGACMLPDAEAERFRRKRIPVLARLRRQELIRRVPDARQNI
ncbi:uncharacterized protein BDR25DRAFT_395608 [Lindgomyces ingoldianus]|uniref:Uncharacterized protein n=1 Tax=Lindgomyces ingoldianus TaxID=673940 RepID=A0ACB6QIM1_9PLEO|nr:uncharacterized protein BDR25DRAFT_395608 [Lindgomyces ingoldianus]KAF2466712.1 hypothetical protein BDR25DRAFT_395608 [Lindgomyces ingoldianus]